MLKHAEVLARGGQLVFAHTPDGMDALVVADLARALARGNRDAPAAILHVSRERSRMQNMERALAFFAPDVDVLLFPSWDVLPYDRASPNPAISAQRMTTLARLARTKQGDKPRVVLTTSNALVQRVTSRAAIAAQSLSVAPGNAVNSDNLIGWLETNGFLRASTVRDTGEYAVRGGIIDLFPPGLPAPVRLDFFGDTLESIRPFDPETQRSTSQLRSLDLVPVSEVLLTQDTMRRFRQSYVAEFGTPQRGDPLYEAVSEGRRYPGVEHWLPLFSDGMETLLDHVPGAAVVLDHQAEDAISQRLNQVADYYDARVSTPDAGGAPYKPLKPNRLYLAEDELKSRLEEAALARLHPFEAEAPKGAKLVDAGGRPGRSFAPERANENANVFEEAARHIRGLQEVGKRVIVAAWSDGARERLAHVLGDHGLEDVREVPRWADAQGLKTGAVALAVLGLEAGFETPDIAIVAEQDILGDRLARGRKKPRRAQDFLTESTGLSAGDIVVHVDHGIGRFVALKAIEALGAPHDCLEIVYAGDTKLYLPVENIELLSRYGSEDTEVQLDRLGGAGWQNRKAKLKQRIREMAGELIKVAAQRQTREATRLLLADTMYEEFAAKFPYDETEDQLNAINAVLDDLAAGRPMDRLVCGDVGFGKTEVALRAAFVTAMNGKQVAVVVPTTLLARQHFRGFEERFRGFPLKVAQASRFVSQADMKKTKEGLASGDVDVVVGTHALLSKAINFKDLGLVIVDEEQHFGVAHKERLKQLRADVHVLTLTATPIPRTLQLALTGVRELSIIATPPVDRLAVRTYVAPFDPLVVREALLRERYRGGQSFYVAPRLEDIKVITAFLEAHVPEVKFIVGHGQMAAGDLEDVMSAFYEGKYDVLVSTTIVESGLDIPNANTLIVHRADMFGLAQLYQLRGRVGRAKTRAYAILTTPEHKTLTVNAEKRLKVLQSLDSLGAGFQLATHDLDIRGAGNLLGDEQSGHIREVGYELYQQMLEEAIEALKEGGEVQVQEQWSPQIAIGTPVLIPETYIEDLELRLGLYRRLSSLSEDEDIAAFGAELKDRFGPRPPEVDHLLKIVRMKALCRRANVEKIDAGPKGVVLSFRDNHFANPDGLIQWLAKERDVKLRPDFKLVFKREWTTPDLRLKGTTNLMKSLVKIAEAGKTVAAA
ncbi:transcription-repair coupling factor [Terrihabitans rhizophilus]|uniref:Transcription-repair-coupling factor n=1 Tax=Terrihabitans rhizophilus TaxID=3092662 RepID=A0ABU4RKF8_9HYPH|nr:transcription-repair coupling factor [Terrihabitans sp. PJ23]MDX6805334.1 transcription-repair coupling factor [Terrihabitans sp. PJ23]